MDKNPSRPGVVCIFCLVHRDRDQAACSYGMHHEYEEDSVAAKPVQVPKKDKNLCSKCGLHPRNPKFNDAGCAHEFP